MIADFALDVAAALIFWLLLAAPIVAVLVYANREEK